MVSSAVEKVLLESELAVLMLGFGVSLNGLPGEGRNGLVISLAFP